MSENIKIFTSPGKYVQGAGSINRLGELIKPLGRRVLVVGGKTGLAVTEKGRAETFIKNGIRQFEEQSDSTTDAEIKKLVKIGKGVGCEIVLACGGGKAIDTAKAAAEILDVPVSILPTIASNDASCRALSVIYNDDGSFSHLLPLVRNPSLVLVDTEIIANAPPEQLVAGMGNALLAFYETETCMKSGVLDAVGERKNMLALTAARLCRDILLEYGRLAKHSCEKRTVTEALEKTIEANVLLSGIGFVSGGVTAAYALAEAFSSVPAARAAKHGETVAFGLLTNLILDGSYEDELDIIYKFCSDVGLPVTLTELGIDSSNTEILHSIAELAAEPNRTSNNLRRGSTADEIFDALIQADRLGQEF